MGVRVGGIQIFAGDENRPRSDALRARRGCGNSSRSAAYTPISPGVAGGDPFRFAMPFITAARKRVPLQFLQEG